MSYGAIKLPDVSDGVSSHTDNVKGRTRKLVCGVAAAAAAVLVVGSVAAVIALTPSPPSQTTPKGQAAPLFVAAGAALLLRGATKNHEPSPGPPKGPCSQAGPQSPRDIRDIVQGTNPVTWNAANLDDMRLCNVHFHQNAEHKGIGFAVENANGHQGYGCNTVPKPASWQAETPPVCLPPKGHDTDGDVGLVVGATVEVHWVYTTCNVAGGVGLGSCTSPSCANPELRVEAATFVVVDGAGDEFLNPTGPLAKWHKSYLAPGIHADMSTPPEDADAVQYLGSTTGPWYNNEDDCSPFQVTWNVRQRCHQIDKASLGQWCESNDYSEMHPHGVRRLVTPPGLLSEIRTD